MELYEGLLYLTRNDRELLQEKTQFVIYRANDVVLKEGERRQAVFSLVEGVLRVEQGLEGQPILLRQLTEGDIFGEISFIEGEPVSASVIAEDDSRVAVIDGQFIHSLLESEPGLALRFYRSLAHILAGRLRSISVATMSPQSWG